MITAELKAKKRVDVGKCPSRRLRREGKIPAVVYGDRVNSLAVSLDHKEFRRIVASQWGENTLINLRVDEDERLEGLTVLIREIQSDPVTDELLHVDLFEVKMDEKVEVEVPVQLRGTPSGVTLGGVLEQERREIRIRCLPSDIPDGIEVDVSDLNIGDAIHVRNVSLPSGTEIMEDEDVVVASVIAPRVEEPEVAAEVLEPEVTGKEEEEEAEEEKEGG
jgi:large subunit ribosomal protein L25